MLPLSNDQCKTCPVPDILIAIKIDGNKNFPEIIQQSLFTI